VEKRREEKKIRGDLLKDRRTVFVVDELAIGDFEYIIFVCNIID